MNKVIADNLEKIMKANSLSKSNFAKIMGITRQTLDKRINGTADLRWTELAKLRLNLGVDLNKILLEEYTFNKFEQKNFDNKTEKLFLDFIGYGIPNDGVRRLILEKIFENYFSNRKSFAKVVKDNRPTTDFASILLNINSAKMGRITKSNAKQLLEQLVKDAKISFLEKSSKKTILKYIKSLNNLDCYYILEFNKIAVEVLINDINFVDKILIKNIGKNRHLFKNNRRLRGLKYV